MKRITVLFGNYGSGKTELALNTALELSETQSDVMLIDLDIVNPYFRSSEHVEMLESKGIRVIAPVYANTAVDLPTLPPDIFSAFSGGHAIFDCGGDAVGAAALGSLKKRFEDARDETQVLFVVNTMRPFQQTADEIVTSLEKIHHSARLKTDGFVLNTNLGKESTGQELIQGYGIIKELTEKTGIPLYAVSGTEDTLRKFTELCSDYQGKMISLTIYTRPDWMENS